MIKISFIIIAYNEERTIGRCLDAILKQTGLSDYEIIAVDDGSKDATADIIKAYAGRNPNIKLNRLSANQGRGSARSAGVKIAQGDYLAFIDADIVLPPDWLPVCLGRMAEYDAVGGIAVPDGDVNYIYGLFNLKPKVVPGTATVSGSNGLYRREIFKAITFDENLREGEDSVFNKAMVSEKFKLFLDPSLIVEHKEARSFAEAMRWLYQIGQGAARQFRQFKIIRLPDLAFFGLITVLIISLFFSIFFKTLLFFLMLAMFILLADLIHFKTKFFFESRRPFRYLGGLAVYWLLLAVYFAGRTTGSFKAMPGSQQKKKVMVCFDFEGQPDDLPRNARRLLSALKKYDVKAVFFIVGRLIEQFPDLAKEIAASGHEIALHGFEHENLKSYTENELAGLDAQLERIGALLSGITGQRPTGFRLPYLMKPIFYKPEVYELFSAHGYKWASNREIRYPEELFRPDRLGFKIFWGKNNLFTRALLIILNLRLVLTDNTAGKKGISRISANIGWLNRGAAPFKRNDILELPVYSPLDCDLLGLPDKNKNTDDRTIEYAITALIHGLDRPGGLYSVNFHDWIIGGANRIKILETVLDNFTKNKNITFITAPEYGQ